MDNLIEVIIVKEEICQIIQKIQIIILFIQMVKKIIFIILNLVMKNGNWIKEIIIAKNDKQVILL
jgi:hypothetical protein